MNPIKYLIQLIYDFENELYEFYEPPCQLFIYPMQSGFFLIPVKIEE